MAAGPTSNDSGELAAFGYKQELDRSLGSFSSFAAGFSYISILTGMFELFGFGYAQAGPPLWWTWVIVLGGQMLVALCFAELAGPVPARRIGLPVVQAGRRRLHRVDDRLDLHRRLVRHRRRGGGRLAGRAAAGLDAASSSSAARPTPAPTAPRTAPRTRSSSARSSSSSRRSSTCSASRSWRGSTTSACSPS